MKYCVYLGGLAIPFIGTFEQCEKYIHDNFVGAWLFGGVEPMLLEDAEKLQENAYLSFDTGHDFTTFSDDECPF